ncbi:DMT family transporter [Lactobacillaceae bacterium Melli_B4]
MIIILGIIAGLILPIQTSINTNLKDYSKGTPFLASMMSFMVGTIVLLFATILHGDSLLISSTVINNQPWWIWLGGLLGVIGLSTNVIIFPYLGAVQTVTMPIFGQILMSMIIDNFGFFDSPLHQFTIVRFLGIILLSIGILMIVLGKNDRETRSNTNRLPWQILGIVAGMFQAAQTPVNGHLGIVLHSSIHAALISFLVGAIILFIITGFTDKGYAKIKNAVGKNKPWWIWLGGLLGAIYVLSNATISPIIGAGNAVILTIVGNLSCSVVVDKYGLLGSTKKHIGIATYLGLIIMICGVVIVKLF